MCNLRCMKHSKKIGLTEFIDELSEMTDQHLQQAVLVYQNLNEDELTRPAVTGGWSIAQCLDHLNGYGDYYLPHLTAAIKRQNFQPTVFVERGWLGDFFIKMMDPDRKAKKYKAAKRHNPPAVLDAYSIVAKFIEQQERLLQLLASAQSVDLNSTRVPTSISSIIKLRLGDTFAFLITHNERHVRQANRNLLI